MAGARELPYRQLPCRFFALGVCKKGVECTYLHDANAVGEAAARETAAHAPERAARKAARMSAASGEHANGSLEIHGEQDAAAYLNTTSGSNPSANTAHHKAREAAVRKNETIGSNPNGSAMGFEAREATARKNAVNSSNPGANVADKEARVIAAHKNPMDSSTPNGSVTDSNAREDATHKNVINSSYLKGSIEAVARGKARYDWRYHVPRDGKEIKKARPLGRRFGEFVAKALQLVNTDAESMQEVVTSLSSEGGLFRLGELLDIANLTEMTGARLQACFQDQLLPLVKLLAHESVLTSAIVETRHATILNYLYGVNGRRAVAAFAAIARCLPVNDQSAIEACVVVISYTLEINGSSEVNDDLKATLQDIVALANKSPLGGIARTHLNRLRVYVDLGTRLPDAPTEDQSLPIPLSKLPEFTIRREQPGELSEDGARHDNDSADITDIAILPTTAEIKSDRLEYLPRDDPASEAFWIVSSDCSAKTPLDSSAMLRRSSSNALLVGRRTARQDSPVQGLAAMPMFSCKTSFSTLTKASSWCCHLINPLSSEGKLLLNAGTGGKSRGDSVLTPSSSCSGLMASQHLSQFRSKRSSPRRELTRSSTLQFTIGTRNGKTKRRHLW